MLSLLQAAPAAPSYLVDVSSPVAVAIAVIGFLGGQAAISSFLMRSVRRSVGETAIEAIKTHATVVREHLLKAELQIIANMSVAVAGLQAEHGSLRSRVDTLDRDARERDRSLARLPDAVDNLAQVSSDSAKLLGEALQRIAKLEGSQVTMAHVETAVGRAVFDGMRTFADQQDARVR